MMEVKWCIATSRALFMVKHGRTDLFRRCTETDKVRERSFESQIDTGMGEWSHILRAVKDSCAA
jgi:hypothetical protein